MKLSVVIPVYKVERTLDRSVESVLRQDIDGETEIILVDDGSPDRCPQLCDAWKDRGVPGMTFRVIHKPNGGLSDARNKGIEIATGDLITFVDSDDELAPDTYAPLVRFMQGNPAVDMLEYSIRHEDETRVLQQLHDHTFTSARKYWLETRGWNHCYACNKIYRRSLFASVRFTKGRLFEDLLIMPELLKHCRRIATTQHGTYIYTCNEAGISRQTSRKALTENLRAMIKAAWTTRTMPWNRNGYNLYYYMMCRIYDIIMA